MCRVDEQDFPIDPRQLTPQDWQSFKQRVTERAQQARQQALRAAAIALPRALLAGACYGGSLLHPISVLIRIWLHAIASGGEWFTLTIGQMGIQAASRFVRACIRNKSFAPSSSGCSASTISGSGITFGRSYICGSASRTADALLTCERIGARPAQNNGPASVLRQLGHG